jgi:hypothetical protein
MPQVLYTSSVISSIFIVPVAPAQSQPVEDTARPGPANPGVALIATDEQTALSF